MLRPGLRAEDMRGELLSTRERACFRESEGVRDFRVDDPLDLRARPIVHHAADPSDFVGADPGVELGIRPVFPLPILIGSDVIAPAIGHAFEKARALALADGGDSARARLADQQGVAALDAFMGDAEDSGALARIGMRHAIPNMRVDRIVIVLAHEENGQFLQRGEVEAFVAHPLVHRALAEEAGDDRLGAPRLEREGVAHRLRDGGRYDGGGSHHMGAHVHQMHRTGLAARATIGLTVEFGYHALEIAALGEIERVAAIGAERDIVRCKRRAHADRDRFLPNREMDRALDLVRRIILDDLFFDSADSIEAAVKSRKRFACRTHPYRSGSGDAAPVGHRSGAMTLENSSRFRAVTNISRPEVQRRTGRGIVLVSRRTVLAGGLAPPIERQAYAVIEPGAGRPAQLARCLAAIERQARFDGRLTQVMADFEALAGGGDDLPHQFADANRDAAARVVERISLSLPIDGALDEVDEVADIKKVPRLLAAAPNLDRVARRHHFRDGGPEDMASLEIELVVRPIDVRMADYGVARSTKAGVKLAHLLDIDLGPAAGEVARLHRQIGVPSVFVERRVAGVKHHRTAEEDEMPDLRLVSGPQQQRIHHGVIGRVDVGLGHNLLGARCGRRRLDDYVHPGDEALDFAGVAQISLVPLDRIRAEGRTPMPYCVEFDIGSLGQMLDEIAADEARRPADQYFAPG